ncbi:2973_t:CDS:2, partial [Gigaspora rosea]
MIDDSYTFSNGTTIPKGRYAINEIKMCLHNLILRDNIKTESKLERNNMFLCLPPNSGLVFEN